MRKRSESVFDGRLVGEGYWRQTRTVIFQGRGIFSGTVEFALRREPFGAAKVRPWVLPVGSRILELSLRSHGACNKDHDGRLYTVGAIRYQPEMPGFLRQME